MKQALALITCLLVSLPCGAQVSQPHTETTTLHLADGKTITVIADAPLTGSDLKQLNSVLKGVSSKPALRWWQRPFHPIRDLEDLGTWANTNNRGAGVSLCSSLMGVAITTLVGVVAGK